MGIISSTTSGSKLRNPGESPRFPPVAKDVLDAFRQLGHRRAPVEHGDLVACPGQSPPDVPAR
jgi:hypothetical protein